MIRSAYYAKTLAVRNVVFKCNPNTVTALIGPSGCGKSTVLRCINRMNDLVSGFRMNGVILYDNQDVTCLEDTFLRKRVGMVFQQANPFHTSIFKNVGFGLPKRTASHKVEESLRNAALWDEVKDKLHTSACLLSGGQQQRLCIARALAVDPKVLLLDEPCSALDPKSTAKIEELIETLKEKLTVVIVTHNLPQARRISDTTAFFSVEQGVGHLVEIGETKNLFESPQRVETHEYVCGLVG